MSKEPKNTALPKLRFPEFREAGEWVETELGANGTFLRGLTYSSENVTTDGLLVVRSSNIQDDNLVLNKDLVFVNINCSPSLLLQKGDVAICMANGSKALVGKSAEFDGEYDKPVTVGAFCSLFRPDNGFAKLVFKTKKYQDFVAFSIGGGNINNLKNSDLEQFSFFIPTDSEEQQKIAATLSSLDDLLTAQTAKLTALQAHKRGLMQALFPAEGETVPKLRFKEFQQVVEWEERKLGDVATFLNGRAYEQSELLETGKYKVLRLGNLFSNNHWYYSDLELDENKYCDNGDLLYAWSASFGPRMWTGEKVIYHYHIWKVLEKKGIGKPFLFILLDNETNKIKEAQANGLGMLHITKGSIEAWKCLVPKNEEEQQKIADCFSSLDARIIAQTQKIEALKLHKQGLMQFLFPTIKK